MTPPLQHSALYECRVWHERFVPRAHQFAYRLFYFALDLDEVPRLSRALAWFSAQGRHVFHFRADDYLPITEPRHNPHPEAAGNPAAEGRLADFAAAQRRSGPVAAADPTGALALKARVRAFCAAHGADFGPHGRVLLVTLPRLFGYQFNPVSFYFCWDGAQRPVGAVAEVSNTFREVKPYFLPVREGVPAAGVGRAGSASGAVFHLRAPKHFYVSPFSPLDLSFDFTLHTPGAKLAVRIDDFAPERRVLHSTLTGERRALTSARLSWFLLKYPLVTLRVITLIHWQAFLLWWKRVPFFRKADGAALQRDLYRPHASLVRTSQT